MERKVNNNVKKTKSSQARTQLGQYQKRNKYWYKYKKLRYSERKLFNYEQS